MDNVSKITCKWFQIKLNVSKFDEEFTKNYDEDSKKGYILEVDVEYPKDLHNLRSDLPLLSERIKIKKNAISFCAMCMIKKNMLFL